MKKLGFGLMRLPLTKEGDPASIDQREVNRMVDRFLEQGFTYFDTAYPYHGGMSEAAAKKALVDRHPRESFLLADKMPVWLVKEQGDYQKYVDQQLQRCGVDYFDYYLLHSLGDKGLGDTERLGGFPFMKELKAQGKAKHIGFSFHDKADVLDRILTRHPEMEFVQLQINYIDWESESIQSRKCYEVAARHGKPVIVMEPVKGGSLASLPEPAEQLLRFCRPHWSPASWAIRYTASLEGVLVVLSGISTWEQLEENTALMADPKPLTEEEQGAIAKVAGTIQDSIAIPCTACRYCVDDCPQNIPIPQYFSLFNNQKQFGILPLHDNYYRNLAHTAGKASACIGCKVCEEHCPQHIEIADWMGQVAETFEKN